MEKELTPIAEAIEKTSNKIEILKISAKRSEIEKDHIQENIRNKEIQILIENIEMLKSLLLKEKEVMKGFYDAGHENTYCMLTEIQSPAVYPYAEEYFNEKFKPN